MRRVTSRLGWIYALTAAQAAQPYTIPVHFSPRPRKHWVQDKDWLQSEPKRNRRRKGRRR